MNTEIDIDQEDIESKSEAAVAKFALECRRIRLFIAANPGATTYDMRQAGIKGRREWALSKMLGMGIVKREPGLDGNREFCWTVVPQ